MPVQSQSSMCQRQHLSTTVCANEAGRTERGPESETCSRTRSFWKPAISNCHYSHAKMEGTHMMHRRAFIGSGAMAISSALAGTRWSRILAAVGNAKAAPGPTVETTAGNVRAIVDGGIAAFRGIPYGASTAGAGRFMPPANVQPWTGVRDAFGVGPRSAQGAAGFTPDVGEVAAHEAEGAGR